MPTIIADRGVVAQINVFTVPEGGQDALIDFLKEAAHASSAVEGWLSASLHRSLDGRHVVNYAQCVDQAAMRRVFEALDADGWIDGNKRFGNASPGLYEVVYTVEK
jgi:quinol monooxygenase YgiN